MANPQSMEPPPLDRFEKAEKFRYDTSVEDPKKRWQKEYTKVCWTKHPVGKGGMRDCFLVWEQDGDGPPTQMIGKIFQADVRATMNDYMSECITQCVSDVYAQMYNKQGVQHKISFLACYLVRMAHIGPNGEKVVFTMEPMLRGIYEKHNNNVGHVFTENPTAEAFTHFTFLSSDKKLLVCDLQGVGGMYTDPQIHSLRGDDYGLGNLGQDGIRKWMAGHKCGPLCTAMGFPPINQAQPKPARALPPPRNFDPHVHAQEMRNTLQKAAGMDPGSPHGARPHVGYRQPGMQPYPAPMLRPATNAHIHGGVHGRPAHGLHMPHAQPPQQQQLRQYQMLHGGAAPPPAGALPRPKEHRHGQTGAVPQDDPRLQEALRASAGLAQEDRARQQQQEEREQRELEKAIQASLRVSVDK